MVTAKARLRRTLIPVLAVATAGASLALHGSWQKSDTADERAHLTAGHSYWKNNDYRLQPENGNLPQRLIALPNVVAGAFYPPLNIEGDGPTFVYVIGQRYLYGAENDATLLLRRSRGMVAIATAVIAVALFAISASTAGLFEGWITLLLFAFSPTVLANGALATSDMIAAGAFIFATWSVWRTIERVTPARIVVATLGVATLLLSKFSGPIFLPIALSMAIMRVYERRPLRVRSLKAQRTVRSARDKGIVIAGAGMLVAGGVVGLIWAAYGFRYDGFDRALPGLAQFEPTWAQLALPPSVAGVIGWMREHRVLPEAYLFGTAHVLSFAEGRFQFLNGTVSTQGGWRFFFPYAALVKSTPPELILGASAFAFGGKWLRTRAMTGRERVRARRLAPFLLLAVWYLGFAIASPLNIGYRHVLPVVLAGFILASAVTLPLRAMRTVR